MSMVKIKNDISLYSVSTAQLASRSGVKPAFIEPAVPPGSRGQQATNYRKELNRMDNFNRFPPTGEDRLTVIMYPPVY